MNNAQFVTALREQIANAQRQGITGISFVDLDAHLVNMADWTAQDEGYQARLHEHSLEVYRQTTLSYLEMFKSIIEYGKEALKAAMLINGAAAGAMLAFLGSVSGQAAHGAARVSLVSGGTWFAYGVLGAACGFGFAYVAQSCHGYSFNNRTGAIARIGHFLTIVCVGSFLFSMAAFSAGAINSRWGLIALSG